MGRALRLWPLVAGVTLAACASRSTAPPAPAPRPPLPANCDGDCYRADRDSFVQSLARHRRVDVEAARRQVRTSRIWSAVAMLGGIAGGVAGLAIADDGTGKLVAGVLSLAAGAASMWVAYHGYEVKAARAEACAAAVDGAAATFRSAWSDANLPPPTEQGRIDYGTAKRTTEEMVIRVCSS